MSQKLSIQEVTWKNEGLYIKSNDTEMDAEQLSPAGKVLVDSNQFAFIYILETPAEYVYLPLPKEHWADLKKVLAEQATVTLFLNNREIVLEHIVEELQYVISNIEGNANYGDQMVEEVEAQFVK
ncbi:hypothetical protein [Bacillus suaedaesalsae]|uniref:Uncharacterized protein n=1 Tax=Bacillus suaedaesalsae TaxID=2810349 RepID=A0ABS2DID4_9BACI|nr:hypothetical protein [Bacillus suaedaesalsae]MBM6618260.1 hypothetical protein [Bacillus suaedaesalsae]